MLMTTVSLEKGGWGAEGLVLSSDVQIASRAILLFLFWYLLQRLSRRMNRSPMAKKATTPMKVASILVLLVPVTNDN